MSNKSKVAPPIVTPIDFIVGNSGDSETGKRSFNSLWQETHIEKMWRSCHTGFRMSWAWIILFKKKKKRIDIENTACFTHDSHMYRVFLKTAKGKISERFDFCKAPGQVWRAPSDMNPVKYSSSEYLSYTLAIKISGEYQHLEPRITFDPWEQIS